MLIFLSFLVLLFAIVLYQLEKGTPCFVGETGCNPPDSAAGYLHDGQLVNINENGGLTMIPNVFYGVWYSFVTITTTG
jgi:hypothetical protein